jgi:LysR family glycine cleavage system transcriptional activator
MSVSLLRLASLDLIRGFVAVGRRMSITLAAADLCLTQSAVSRQIRHLEQLLGVALFVRRHKAIAFTAQGERLFRAADAAVQQLQDAVGSLRAHAEREPVTISCAIGAANLWVLPRLNRLQHDHPDVDVRLAVNNAVDDLRKEGLDLAIRYCAEATAPGGAIRLFDERVAPVAHPALAGALSSPADIEKLVLLEFDGEYRPWLRWNEWLEGQGWAGVKPKGILRFNHYDLVVHAAIAGQGVALGRLGLLDLMLADGRLATLSAPRPGPATSYAYWLLQADPAPRPQVRQVAAWIRAQARLTAA